MARADADRPVGRDVEFEVAEAEPGRRLAWRVGHRSALRSRGLRWTSRPPGAASTKATWARTSDCAAYGGYYRDGRDEGEGRAGRRAPAAQGRRRGSSGYDAGDVLTSSDRLTVHAPGRQLGDLELGAGSYEELLGLVPEHVDSQVACRIASPARNSIYLYATPSAGTARIAIAVWRISRTSSSR